MLVAYSRFLGSKPGSGKFQVASSWSERRATEGLQGSSFRLYTSIPLKVSMHCALKNPGAKHHTRYSSWDQSAFMGCIWTLGARNMMLL